jgi:hypothetical protein
MMVRKYLPLAEMLRMERRARASSDFGEGIFILDTNAFKYNYGGAPGNVVVTTGVIDELSNNPGIFPQETIRQLADLLNPGVISPFVSSENEALIYRASMQLPKNEQRLDGQGLGWVDTQQIAYAMDLAKEGLDVALVSNDADFHNAVRKLGEDVLGVRERVYCLSARKYLQEVHGDLLLGLNRRFRLFLLDELDREYRAA